MNVVVSAPRKNGTQSHLFHIICEYCVEAGCKVIQGNPLHLMDIESRISRIVEADIVVVCFDTFYPRGALPFLLKDVKVDKLDVPLPPEIINLIAIGMQSTGIAEVKPKSGLILPGDDPRGVEVSNVPNTFIVKAEGGVFGNNVLNGPFITPDCDVMIDFGIAVSNKKTIVGVSLSTSEVSPGVVRHCKKMITDLKNATTVLSEVVASFAHGDESKNNE